MAPGQDELQSLKALCPDGSYKPHRRQDDLLQDSASFRRRNDDATLDGACCSVRPPGEARRHSHAHACAESNQESTGSAPPNFPEPHKFRHHHHASFSLEREQQQPANRAAAMARQRWRGSSFGSMRSVISGRAHLGEVVRSCPPCVYVRCSHAIIAPSSQSSSPRFSAAHLAPGHTASNIERW